ncbi:MAG: hypothetical protein IKO73_07675 [Bacteroidaceae bacterium]|nr:hypothetical protein [Bacteroidaceae bacterium]
MINILFTAFMLTALPDDTIPPTHERTDTLKEVEVLAPESTAGLEDAIRQSLKKMGIDPRTPSVSDVINKISPGLTDKIMHPFAIKDRKKARKRKRDQKILDDFDGTKSFDDLLREALKREGIVIPEREEKKSR